VSTKTLENRTVLSGGLDEGAPVPSLGCHNEDSRLNANDKP
jgi:hypothetical protein